MEDKKPSPEPTPKPERVDVIGGFFNGSFVAVVSYRDEVFGIKEDNQYQLMESIRLSIEKRNEVKHE